jgi:hypothetical protein
MRPAAGADASRKEGEESWSRLFVLNVEEPNPRPPHLAATVDARRECGLANDDVQGVTAAFNILQRRRPGGLRSRRPLAHGQSDAR